MTEFIFENETEEKIADRQLAELKRVCDAVLKEEQCNFDAEISFTITDNDGIREINRLYRDIDKATDVLSFPMLEFEDNETDAEFETDNGLVMLGDIVISLEKAKEQAISLNHSLRREMAFLTAHSMLHLLGYDHVDDEEGERIMMEKQSHILDRLGITRDVKGFDENE